MAGLRVLVIMVIVVVALSLTATAAAAAGGNHESIGLQDSDGARIIDDETAAALRLADNDQTRADDDRKIRLAVRALSRSRWFKTDLGKRRSAMFRSDLGRRSAWRRSAWPASSEEVSDDGPQRRAMFRSDLGKRYPYSYSRRMFRTDLGKRQMFRHDLG